MGKTRCFCSTGLNFDGIDRKQGTGSTPSPIGSELKAFGDVDALFFGGLSYVLFYTLVRFVCRLFNVCVRNIIQFSH